MTATGGSRGPDAEPPDGASLDAPLAPESREFLDALPVGILVHRDGHVLLANREAARLVGLNGAEELVGRNVFEFLDPAHRDRAERRARRVQDGGEQVGPTAYRVRGSGEDARHVEVTGRPVEHGGERASQVMVRDVTEQRRAQESLRRQEKQFRELLDSAPLPIAVHDGDRFRYVNAEFARMLGWDDPDELVGASPDRVVPEDRREQFHELRRRVMEDHEVVDVSAGRLRCRDGGIRIVEGRAIPATYRGDPAVQVAVRDVTRQRRARRALEESERRYRAIFEENVAGVFRSTPEGRILECNRAFAEMLGYDSPDRVADVSAADFFASSEGRRDYLETLREEGAVHNYELHLETRDGSDLWALENARLEESGDGDAVIYGTLVDVTEERRLRKRLEEMAYHDPLTGLPNRRLLAEHARQVLGAAERRGDRVGVIYLDLARFKRVNDTLGHSAGDRVLVQAAERLREELREGDTAARVGGDEFALLVPDVEDAEAAAEVAQRIQAELGRPFRVSGRSFRVTPQGGVAVFPEHGDTFPDLFSAADRAMYRAKREPGTQITVADPGTEVPSPDVLVEEEELRHALEEGRLVPHYQPVFTASGLDLVGAEVLVRWQHPERGLLKAGDFIHLAERTGVVRELDLHMLDRAVARAARWCADGVVEWISVNLSPASFEPDGIVQRVRKRLEEEGVAPDRLWLEVTEQVSVRKPKEAARTLAQLHDLGVRVSIDDFGTGHSALAYLHRFPADVLKLDRLFVDRLGRSVREERLVEGILGLGRKMGMTVAAEGVEREDQVEWLRSRGCDLLQGHYFSRAVPPSEFPGAG